MQIKSIKNTTNELTPVGIMLKKALQDELRFQKHNATGRLSRSLRYKILNSVGLSILNVTSSVAYWKAVNNPKFAKKTNIETIRRWVATKGLPDSAAYPIYQKLTNNKKTNRRGYYGKPYAYWTEGNDLRRTDFAGYVANKHSKEVADKLAPSIGVDVANMISKQIKKNNPKTNVQRAL